jgi:hypothetical protein
MGPLFPFVNYIRVATSFRPLYRKSAEQARCGTRDKLQQQHNKNCLCFIFIYLIQMGFLGYLVIVSIKPYSTHQCLSEYRVTVHDPPGKN